MPAFQRRGRVVGPNGVGRKVVRAPLGSRTSRVTKLCQRLPWSVLSAAHRDGATDTSLREPQRVWVPQIQWQYRITRPSHGAVNRCAALRAAG